MKLLAFIVAGCCATHFAYAQNELPFTSGDVRITFARTGGGFSLQRKGEAVFTSAPGHLDFLRQGSTHHVTQLERSTAGPDGAVTLQYATSLAGAKAIVVVTPKPDSVRLTVSLLHSEGNLTPVLRFQLSPSGLWYGGGFQGWRDPQTFPLNQAAIRRRAFLADGNTQGTPVWYSTKGVALWIRTPRDFFYSVQAGVLSAEMPQASSITLDVLLSSNIRTMVQRINREIGFPRNVPPADYFRLPIYTTWVEHKVPVSQAKVLEYARAIHSNKLPCGVIEIDDKWEGKYGDTEFDSSKFPDPKSMVAELHKLSYRVTLWVHPFVNIDSETYAKSPGLLLRNANGQPGLIQWWNGSAAIWDVTNPKAIAEFRARLTRLQKLYGFDGFKFDGADVNLTPRDASALDPSQYADFYNREMTAHFAWEETRVGVYSQPLGIVQRLIDKHSVWGRENGLAATLPEAITVSMRGFPYVMPDMVGGNQYDNDRIDAELLIRWAQASALMPLLQFSLGPWHLGEEAVRLCREASELHTQFAPYIIRLAQQASKTGEAILRPLWYESPGDPETFSITDQFLIGDSVLVAPVLQKGAVSRSFYLPAGKWRDRKTGRILEGKQWIRDYPAPLDTLPLFLREGFEIPQ